ncbi:MAG: IS66 family insertion sequence element accessory protein TnpB [Clostridia bacterium]|nr:IS66 family insertion sequence element accessory protein TnpB [Clostridia bacterium]
MEQGLQKLNADQRLAVWTQRIAGCRSSGKSVKHWCQENDISEKTYYYWQRRIFRIAQEQQSPEFTELHSFRAVSAVAASLEISGVNVQVYAGADESTLSALFHALSSC